MGIYLHLFDTNSAFTETYEGTGYTEPWVSYTESSDRVDYNNVLAKPFTIVSLGSGNVSWNLNEKNILYSKNKGSWATMDSGTSIPVSEGDVIEFKGNNGNYCGNTISVTTSFNVEGNIMSLLSNDYLGLDTVPSNGFRSLLSGTNVVSANNLLLPATTVSERGYQSLFYSCSDLTSVPKIFANTYNGAFGCAYMFAGCVSISEMPELIATSATGSGVYYGMFSGCTSLSIVHNIALRDFKNTACLGMFSGSGIKETPEITMDSVNASSFTHTFANCTNLNKVNFSINLQGSTGTYYGMFSGCTSLEIAPDILPTTYSDTNPPRYGYMFYGCSKLRYIKCLCESVGYASSTGSFNNWVYGVSETGTIVLNSANTYTKSYGPSAIPLDSEHKWTIQTVSP